MIMSLNCQKIICLHFRKFGGEKTISTSAGAISFFGIHYHTYSTRLHAGEYGGSLMGHKYQIT